MVSTVSLKASGLYTSNNPFLNPEGSLQEAKNVMVRRDGILESRRGYKDLPFSIDMNTSPEQILFYKNRLIRHVDNKLQHCDSNGVVSDFVYSKNITSEQRLRYTEDGGNLLFTTDNGVKKISLRSGDDYTTTTPIINAGVIKSITPTAEIIYKYGGLEGILPIDSVCSYKGVWSYIDENDKLIQGTPSEAYVVFNNYSTILYNDYNKFLHELCNVSIDDTKSPIFSLSGITQDIFRVTDITTTYDFYSLFKSLCSTIDGNFKYNQGTYGFVFSSNDKYYVGSDNTLVFSSNSHIKWGDYFKVGNYIEIRNSTQNSVGFTLDGKYEIYSIDDGLTTDRKLTLKPYLDYNLKEIVKSSAVVLTTEQIYSYNFSKLFDDVVISEVTNPSYITYNKLQTILNSFRSLLQTELKQSLTDNSYQRISILRNTLYNSLEITVSIPSEIIEFKNKVKFFFQLYRSDIVSNATISTSVVRSPSDNHYLCLEYYPTDTDYTNKYIKYRDITPDNLKTTPLYTNANDGEGILQTNDRPPISNDVVQFNDYTFYSNVRPLTYAKLQLLGVDYLLENSSGNTPLIINDIEYYPVVSSKKQLLINVDSAIDNDYIIIKGDYNKYKFIFLSGDVSNIEYSNEYIVIPVYLPISYTVEMKRTAFINAIKTVVFDFTYISTINSDISIINNKEGIIGVACEASSNITFTEYEGTGEDLVNRKFIISTNSSPAKAVTLTCESLIRVVNAYENSNVIAYYLSSDSDLPGLMYFQSKNVEENIVIEWNIDDILYPNKKNVFLPSLYNGNTYTSYREIIKNYIYYSKYQQGEHVPVNNYIPIGNKEYEILKIQQLRDSLFIFKEDGVYRLTGTSAPFTVDLFDSSLKLIAYDSVAVVGNFLFGFAKNGIFMMNDSSYKLISTNIDNLLLPLFPTYGSDFKTKTFGLGYESDNSYIIFTQDITNSGNIIGYRYSLIFDSWTIYDIKATCGCINIDDLMYIGKDNKKIAVERKLFNRTDYADNEYSYTLTVNNLESDNVIYMGELFNETLPEVGDVIVQEQSLSNEQFNGLLNTLDGIDDFTYKNYSLLEVDYGNDILSNLNTLKQVLNMYESAVLNTILDFEGYNTAAERYNYIISVINSQLGYNIIDAIPSTIECKITALNGSKIILEKKDSALLLQLGIITLYKSIPCSFVYSPQSFNDPLSLKHFREITLMIEHRQLKGLSLTFSSDFMPNIVELDCSLDGYKAFGMGGFGLGTFGGQSNYAPIRTFVPRTHQRCRYLNVGFKHFSAREQWGVAGLTLTGEISSTKAYR